MALIVEDGTGIANANAYISEAEADAYFAARNNTVWAGKTTAEKEAAILYATVYLDARFAWHGNVKFTDQTLDWPRILVYDDEGRNIDTNSVPQKVKDATAELALVALDASLAPALARGGHVKRQKVGSLEIEYFDKAISSTTFPLVSQILSGLSRSKSVTHLVRA